MNARSIVNKMTDVEHILLNLTRMSLLLLKCGSLHPYSTAKLLHKVFVYFDKIVELVEMELPALSMKTLHVQKLIAANEYKMSGAILGLVRERFLSGSIRTFRVLNLFSFF